MLLGPNNRNIKLSVLVSLIIGLGLDIFGLLEHTSTSRTILMSEENLERFETFKKKVRDFVVDRLSGIISIVLIIGLPYYLGHQRTSFFGRYSTTLMLINSIYIIVLLLTVFTFSI